MSGQWDGGKGDKKRPSNISYEEYGNRYDKIFGKKNYGNVDRVEEASEVEVGYSDYCLFLDDENCEKNDEEE